MRAVLAAVLLAAMIQPQVADLYDKRARERMQQGDVAGALSDLRKAAEADPGNFNRHNVLGLFIHERVMKGDVSLIGEGLLALQRAEKLRPDDYGPLVYHSLLLGELAKVEKDAGKRNAILVEAAQVRQRATDLMNSESGMRAPVLRKRVDPQYSREAAKAGIEGVVVLRAIIDKEGKVRDVTVLVSLPLGLDRAAVTAVKQWIFEPARLEGEPVEVPYTISVKFPPR